MTINKEFLDEIRVEISQGINEIQFLFKKMPECTSEEVEFLSEFGKRICKDILKNSESLGVALENSAFEE